MRAAIVGAGSIGIVVGALIAQKGGQVDLIDVYEPNVEALRKKGATITGHMDVNVPVNALTPAQIEGTYDLMLVVTKQTQNKVVLPMVAKHLSKDGLVLTLQNGVPEEEIGTYVGKERVAGGTVGFGATFLLPGITNLTSPKEALENAFEIGELNGETTERIQKAQQLLSMCGGTIIHDNLVGARWTKLLINSTMSGMSAALGCTYGDVLENEIAINSAARIADETVRVSKANGIELVYMIGATFDDFIIGQADEIPRKLDKIHHIWDPHGALKASMLQDLEKKQPTEIDYINGHVCKKGRECGIATPFNDKVVELVKAQEKEGKVNTISAVSAFEALLKQTR